jgi:hypothetical protein
MQQLLDNPFLLLFLGVLIPMVYNLWGVVEILLLPWPSMQKGPA